MGWSFSLKFCIKNTGNLYYTNIDKQNKKELTFQAKLYFITHCKPDISDSVLRYF